MFKNYLLVTLRNIKKSKGYVLINIAGLAIGMAVCILIWQYVSYEKSYDTFHEKGKNLYRLELAVHKNGSIFHTANSPHGLGPALKAEFPEVLEYARIFGYENGLVSYKDFSARVKHAYCADNSFINLFSLTMIKGSAENALAEPSCAVISESIAKKFFGDENPVGKNIHFDRIEYGEYVVKGVFRDFNANSHLQFDMLFSIHKFIKYHVGGWDRLNYFTYIMLRPGSDPKSLEARLPGMLERYIGEKTRANQKKWVFSIQPVPDIYLHSPDPGWDMKSGDMTTVNFLSIIAIFILIIAWVNYINLSTSRSLDRAKEVGLRKVMGANRSQLIGQFLLESFLVNSTGAITAIIIVKIFSPAFNRLLGVPGSFSLLGKVDFLIIMLVLLAFGSALSGLYPAFIISSHKPVSVVQGKLKSRASGILLKKILVIFQITASVMMIAGTYTIYKQVSFMRKQDLGINLDNIMLISAPAIVGRNKGMRQNLFSFFKEIHEYEGIIRATTGNIPGRSYQSSTDIVKKDNSSFRARRCWVDAGYLTTFGIELIAGRDFSPIFRTDATESVILNELAVKQLGIGTPEEAVGKILALDMGKKKMKIVGVVKNYHQKSLKFPIQPVVFQYPSYYACSYYVLKLKAADIKGTMAFVKEKWDEFFPGDPFEYSFLDEYFDLQYGAEISFAKMFGVFALLAIFVACIGLFGFSSLSALQRTKEIGIRKVFGASTGSILYLLSKDSLKFLVISMLIGFPIAFYIFSNWLESYAYRLEMGVWFFLIPIFLVTPIILMTISYHVIKTAALNPIEPLRYE
jgi:putative ABC transport system permease protein